MSDEERTNLNAAIVQQHRTSPDVLNRGVQRLGLYLEVTAGNIITVHQWAVCDVAVRMNHPAVGLQSSTSIEQVAPIWRH